MGCLTMEQIRRRVMSGKLKRLPSEYQEVEYIRNDTNGYIDTDYIPQGDETFFVDFEIISLPSSGEWLKLFGCRKGTSVTSRYNCWLGANESGTLYPRFGTVNASDTISLSTGNHEISVDTSNCVINVDGVAHTFTGSTISGITDPTYFNNVYGAGTLYMGGVTDYRSFVISRNGAPVLDFVPCYRISDNAVGMYDMVSRTFFTNYGSGTFTAGPDVN